MRSAFVVLLVCVLLLTGCQINANPPPGGNNGVQEPPLSDRISSLTLEQKVGQLLYIGFTENDLTVNQAILSDIQPGGLILFPRNFVTLDQTVAALNAYRQNSDLAWPLFVGTDQEGGRVSRLPAAWATRFPTARSVGQNVSSARDLAEAMGAELAALGLNMDFAPVLDVHSNPQNPVIGDRSFGSTPEKVWAAAQKVIAGLQASGIVPVVKHFPGHGDTSTDSHLELPSVTADRSLLESRELQPFRDAVTSGVPVVMVGHLLVPALDPDQPASLSRPIITGLLREQWGYDGLIVTDDMEMGAIAQDDIGEASVQAVLAGVDMLLICHTPAKQQAARDALVAAVQSGRITEQRLDQSLTRILALKDQYQLSRTAVDAAQASQVVGSPEHRNLVKSLEK